MPLNYFLKTNHTQSATIHKKSEIEPVENNGFKFHSLMNFDEAKKFEIYFTEYHPHTQTDASSHYVGVEEYALVVSGNLSVYVEDTKYEVSEGDVIHFVADKSHYYCNETDLTAKAYILMFYPDIIG